MALFKSNIASLTVALGLVSGLVLAPTGAFAQDADQDMRQVELMAADRSGMPEGMAGETWMEASGEARVVSRENGEDVVEVEASGLVPDGLYTIWWVTPQTIGMDMGPGGGAPENEFRADAEGNAATTVRVPSDNTYGMLVVAYHADNQTHGETPGEMGSQTFEQLMGAWPGPEGEMSDM